VYLSGQTYNWVITVCSREAEKQCPVFPGPVFRQSWPFADPAQFRGSPDEVREQVRHLALEVRAKVGLFIEETKVR
jgi:arsenate reductase